MGQSTRSWQRLRLTRLIAAAFVLGCCIVVGPRPAAATCGDHLRPQKLDRPFNPNVPSYSSLAENAPRPEPSLPTPLCTGPHCGRHLPAPPQSPALPWARAHSQQAATNRSPSVVNLAAAPEWLARRTDSPSSERIPQRLERPPKGA